MKKTILKENNLLTIAPKSTLVEPLKYSEGDFSEEINISENETILETISRSPSPSPSEIEKWLQLVDLKETTTQKQKTKNNTNKTTLTNDEIDTFISKEKEIFLEKFQSKLQQSNNRNTSTPLTSQYTATSFPLIKP